MTNTDLHSYYQDILSRVLNEELSLPSQPDVMMKVRQAVGEENTNCESLTEIISKDPGLTAFFMQTAASPLYRRAVLPKSLAEVIGIMGFSATSSLVMLYSSRHLVELKDASSKKIFDHTWKRVVVKTSVASFFAKQFKFHPVDYVQMAMLLTEIGSLSVLSAMLNSDEMPDENIYFQMCREYSKNIGAKVLEKWSVDQTIIDMNTQCGQWDKTWGDELSLLDIANLALYYTVKITVNNPSLPELKTLAAYEKIPSSQEVCAKANWLDIVVENKEEIQSIISSFS